MQNSHRSTLRFSRCWIEPALPFTLFKRSGPLSRVSGYDLISYGNMIQCEPRMSAYATALRGAITPGCTVIDIGAGPGLFSILACQYGAGKVIAIEPDPSIKLLHDFARDNGFSDRIEIVEGVSTAYRPQVKANVIVSDLRGGLPLYESHVHTIGDARERLLAPGGILIPARDHIRVAAVESLETYARFDEPWRSNAYDVDLSAASRFVINSQSQVDLTEEVLLGTPQHVATLDYRTIAECNLRSAVALPIERAGQVHGLLLWFDAELADGVTYSNAPGQPPQVYRQIFLALERPLTVAAGDTLHAEIRANLVDGTYIWSWNTGLARGPDGAVAPCFRQSTFLAKIFDADQLGGRSERFVPQAGQQVALDAFCLSLIDGKRDLKAIADRVEAQFPAVFADSSSALNRVTEVARRYGGDSI